RPPERRLQRRVGCAEGLLHEDAPADRLDALVGAQHLLAVEVTPDRRRVRGIRRRAQRGTDLRQRREAPVAEPEGDGRMREGVAARVDGVRVLRAGPDAVDDLAHGLEVDVGHDDASAVLLPDGDPDVWLRLLLEVDRPVVGTLCAGAEEVTPQALATAAEP